MKLKSFVQSFRPVHSCAADLALKIVWIVFALLLLFIHFGFIPFDNVKMSHESTVYNTWTIKSSAKHWSPPLRLANWWTVHSFAPKRKKNEPNKHKKKKITS